MANYYIATTGNDTTGSGTLVAPWLTLAKALASSASGDTIYIAAGTYTFTNITTTAMSGRILQGADATTTIFDGSAADVTWSVSGVSSINDLTFYNIKNDGPADMNQSGVFFGYLNHTTTFNRCIFNHIIGTTLSGSVFTHSWSASESNFILNNCLLYDWSGVGTQDCIQTKGYNTNATSRWECYNCTFDLTDSVMGYFVRSTVTPTWKMVNCIVYRASGGAKNMLFTAGSTAIATTCDFYGDIANNIPVSTGNITTDPVFVSVSDRNYNLQPTSPCIGTGTLI